SSAATMAALHATKPTSRTAKPARTTPRVDRPGTDGGEAAPDADRGEPAPGDAGGQRSGRNPSVEGFDRDDARREPCREPGRDEPGGDRGDGGCGQRQDGEAPRPGEMAGDAIERRIDGGRGEHTEAESGRSSDPADHGAAGQDRCFQLR